MIFSIICALRVVESLVVCTYFNPDEYWQSLEVAHNLVFGYGHVTWEWQPHARIRGFAHPLLFAVYYQILQTLGLDSRFLVAFGPRVIQALLAACGDYALYLLAKRLFGAAVARLSLLCQMTCWFMAYVSVRTYSNSLEAIFTTCAFLFWPWRNVSPANILPSKFPLSERQLSLCLAAVSFIFRPTSGVVWAVMGIHHLLTCNDPISLIFKEVAPIGALALGASTWLDCKLYGAFTLVPWNFVQFNSIFAVSELYGTHPFHWYFSQGFPVMLLSFVPLFILGIVYTRAWQQFTPATPIFLTMLVYSFNAHKEFRFLLPVLPAALIYCGYALHHLHVSISFPLRVGMERSQPMWWQRFGRFIINLLFVVQIGAFFFFAVIHQRAPEAVLNHLASSLPESYSISESVSAQHALWNQPSPHCQLTDSSEHWRGVSSTDILDSFSWHRRWNRSSCDALSEMTTSPSSSSSFVLTSRVQAVTQRPLSVHFLMPCHSTPFYSHLHLPFFVPLRILDCAPRPSNNKLQRAAGVTESETFEHDPAVFVQNFYCDPLSSSSCAESAKEWLPTHVVMYERESIKLSSWLASQGYSREARFFHSFSSDENAMVLYSTFK